MPPQLEKNHVVPTAWQDEVPMQEMQALSLGREDLLEKATNGNPLQYSCLGNPMDRGVWWAAVHGVTKESDMIW